MSVVIRMVNYGLVTGRELAVEAEEADHVMGKVGIFTLEEVEIEDLFRQSHNMRTLARHVHAIEHLQWFIKEAHENGPALVRLAAIIHGVDIGGHFENIKTIPLADLSKIVKDPYIKQVEKSIKDRGSEAPKSLIAPTTPSAGSGIMF